MPTETEKQLKRIADALNRAFPYEDISLANAPRRLVEPGVLDVTYTGATPPTVEQVAELRRLLDRRLAEQPPAEGDWLLETERAEAGDDVD